MHKLIIPLLLFISACKNTPEKTKPVVTNITEAVYASGIIKSKNQYEAYSTVTGIIKQIYVQENETIGKNQPILLIENEASTIMKENAELALQNASLSSNRAKLDELKLNIEFAYNKLINDSLLYNRQQALYQQKIGSKTELEQKQLNYRLALTNYKTAVLKLNDFKRQLQFNQEQSQKNFQLSSKQSNDFLLKSLINGKVYFLNKKPGELVTPQTPLAVVGSANNFYIELQIDEYDITRIALNQKIYITLDSYSNKVYEGVVTKINPMMNEKTKSFTIEADFIHPPQTLYPNLTAEANIIIKEKKNALTLPRKFVTINNRVVKPNGEKIKVTTGLMDLEKIEITSGISENDEVILPQ